jgi:hypothetical protein
MVHVSSTGRSKVWSASSTGECPLSAILASAGDGDSLINFVNHHRVEMDPAARKTFDEIDFLRIDFRINGTQPG